MLVETAKGETVPNHQKTGQVQLYYFHQKTINVIILEKLIGITYYTVQIQQIRTFTYFTCLVRNVPNKTKEWLPKCE